MKHEKEIKLNESQLREMIEEGIKNVLKENVEGIKAKEQIQSIIKQIIDLTSSGYIPFSSPAPSSTEMIVKKNVMQALQCLDTAYKAACQLDRG